MGALAYSKNDTEASNVTYSLKAEDSIIDRFSGNNMLDVEEYFVVCNNDKDCQDYDGCTRDRCNQSTKICENEEVVNNRCSNCKWVTVNLTTDNYPDDTTWSLSRNDNDNNANYHIIVGDPYPHYLIKEGTDKKWFLGRKKKNGR